MSQTSPAASLSSLKTRVEVFTIECQAECPEDSIQHELHRLIQDLQRGISNLQFDDELINTFGDYVVPALELLFVHLLQRINDNLCVENQVELTTLQSVVDIISLLATSLQRLVNHMTESQCKINTKSLELSKPVFHVLHASYNHCKISEQLYGDSFGSAANILKELFEKTFALQKIVGSLLSKVEIVSKHCFEQDLLMSVSQKLFEICQVVNGIDNMLLASSWKLLVSFLVKSKSILINTKELAVYAKDLIECARALLNDMVKVCSDTNSQKGGSNWSNLSKLCIFHINLLSNLSSNFSLSDCEWIAKLVVDFVVDAINRTTHFYIEKDSFPIAVRELFSATLLDSLSKCLDTMKTSSSLQDIIFSQGNDVNHLTKLIISMKLCLIVATSTFKNQEMWYMSNGSSLIQAIFELLPYVHKELCLCKAVNISGNAMPLYECVLTHVCAFAATYSPSTFNHLEQILLINTFSSHPYKQFLAADLWCFVVKNSNSVGHQHVRMLIEFLSSSQLSSCDENKVGCVLKRLFPHLSTTHQTNLMNRHDLSNDGNLIVWRHLGGKFVALSTKAFNLFLLACDKVAAAIESWVSNEGSLSGIDKVIKSVGMLEEILSENSTKIPEFQKNSKSQSSLSTVTNNLLHLWLSLPLPSPVHQNVVVLYSYIAQCFVILIPHCFDTACIRKILKRSLSIMNSSTHQPAVPHTLYYHLAEMCESLKSSTLSSDTQNDVALLWRRLVEVSDSNWHLRFEILCAFERFSKSTEHPHLVARVCADNVTSRVGSDVTDIGGVVKEHLQRVVCPLPPNLTETDVIVRDGQALLEVDRLSRCEKQNPRKRLRLTVEEIARNVQKLKQFKAEDLNKEDLESLKGSVLNITALLPDR